MEPIKEYLKNFMVRNKKYHKKYSSLVLIGGNTGTSTYADNIYQQIYQLSGGKKGKVGIITSANTPYDWDCKDNGTSTEGGCNDPRAKNSKIAANRYISRFTQHGINSEWLPIDLANTELANDEKLAQRILKGEFTGFFFGGGKQTDHIKTFYHNSKDSKQESAVLSAIRAKFSEGGLVIAGTSAGAVVQSSDTMIVAGRSNQALIEGAIEDDQPVGSNLKYLKNQGFGFFDYGIIDSHFSQRGREGRAIRLASDTGNNLIFGIDEATALVVTKANKPGAKMKVVGRNGVQLLKLSYAKSQINKRNLWSIKNVESSYLTDGDQYIPVKDKIIFHPKKKNLINKERLSGEIKPSQDIFSSRRSAKNEFINTAKKLVDTKDIKTAYGYPRTKEVKYVVRFKKTNQTKAYYDEQNGERVISYSGLKITIRPRKNRDF
ncbi:MAG: cyanophycinase [Bacteroidales bacterium]|nr:cyanophycinase [Bacteroidales bacterium]